MIGFEDNIVSSAMNDARAQLSRADAVNVDDTLALVASQAALAATVERLLWTMSVMGSTEVREALGY